MAEATAACAGPVEVTMVGAEKTAKDARWGSRNGC